MALSFSPFSIKNSINQLLFSFFVGMLERENTDNFERCTKTTPLTYMQCICIAIYGFDRSSNVCVTLE